MKRKHRRTWVAVVKRPPLEVRDCGPSEDEQGRYLSIDHPADFYEEQQPDSTHLLRCPKCGMQRYVDRRFVESMEEITREAEGTDIQVIGARHKECATVLEVEAL